MEGEKEMQQLIDPMHPSQRQESGKANEGTSEETLRECRACPPSEQPRCHVRRTSRYGCQQTWLKANASFLSITMAAHHACHFTKYHDGGFCECPCGARRDYRDA